MANGIDKSKSISPNIETHVLALAARGYTVRRIKELAGLQNVPDAVIVNIIGDKTFDEERTAIDSLTLQRYGLASTLERVRRLAEIAETLEDRIFQGQLDILPEYRQLLRAIREELQPFNIQLTVGDPWANLLKQLAAIGTESNLEVLDEGYSRTETSSDKCPGDNTVS